MLFTRIQIDDFYPAVARLKERILLNPEEVTKAEWTMMAVLNISWLKANIEVKVNLQGDNP